MARDATSRLYDVDEDSVLYKKPKLRGKYDHGTIQFSAKKGKLVDLDKLHESIWATRLSGGTRSGLIQLDVTAVGEVVMNGKATVLNVQGSDRHFVLIGDSENSTKEGTKTAFRKLIESMGRGDKVVSVTGRVEGWNGGWPTVLRKLPAKPRRIIVTNFQIEKESSN